MSSEKPCQKRVKRRRGSGNLESLKRELWAAVRCAGDLLEDPDVNVKLRAVNGLAQAATAYRGLYEVADMEARLEEVERLLSIKKAA